MANVDDVPELERLCGPDGAAIHEAIGDEAFYALFRMEEESAWRKIRETEPDRICLRVRCATAGRGYLILFDPEPGPFRVNSSSEVPITGIPNTDSPNTADTTAGEPGACPPASADPPDVPGTSRPMSDDPPPVQAVRRRLEAGERPTDDELAKLTMWERDALERLYRVKLIDRGPAPPWAQRSASSGPKEY